MNLTHLGTRLADLVWPPRCAGCDEVSPLGHHAVLCTTCELTVVPLGLHTCSGCALPLPGDLAAAGAEATEARCAGCRASPWPFARAAAAVAYGGAITDAILRFKHAGRVDLATPLARLLTPTLAWVMADGIDAVVPVPLHGKRLRQRGFNQAALLFQSARRWLPQPAPLVTEALLRVRDTATLGHGSPAQRHAAVDGAFAVTTAGARRLHGARILLVDDVMTTGATARACARALLDAGVASVSVAVLARAE